MSTLDQEIATLNNKLTDEWHTLITGIYYKKIMDICFIRCYITNNSFSTTYKIIGTLPVGYRPPDTIYHVCGFSSGGQGIVYFSANGDIGIKTDTGTAPNVWFLASFPVAE